MTINHTSHEQLERSLEEIDWATYTQRAYTASPAAWEDQVLYFLMLDRFSDGREKGYRDNAGNPVTAGETPLFRFPDDAYTADRVAWAEDGNCWLGGKLKGLESKIGYLQRMGVGTLWISPVFKQVESDKHSYHGYGIQNFLDVDPNFGSRQDLIDLVNTAHVHGIRVILDIILNHAGDVFGYRPRHPRLRLAQRRSMAIGAASRGHIYRQGSYQQLGLRPGVLRGRFRHPEGHQSRRARPGRGS
jgi:1,4-alpha-glucan branching enzyme